MRDLITNSNKTSLLVAAVQTRSTKRTKEQQDLTEGLKSFNQASGHTMPEPQTLEEREETDYASSGTSDESESEDDQSSPDRAETRCYAARTPVTAEEKSQALQEYHNNPLAGHFRARRTLEKLQRRYF